MSGLIKRKYYLLSEETIKYVKILALNLNKSEHDLVNEILSNYTEQQSKK